MTTNTLHLTFDPPLATKDGGTIPSVTLRELTGAQAREVEAKATTASPSALTRHQVALFAASGGMKPGDVELLPLREFQRGIDFLRTLDSPAEADSADAEQPELTIPLDPPVSSGVVQYAALTLTPPTVGARLMAEAAMGGFPKSPAAAARAYQIKLVAEAAHMDFAAAEQLPTSVLARGMAYLQGFFGPGPETGPT